MSSSRRCSRNSCARPAVATLTYVYADSTAVVGPLAAHPEPHSYDLCQAHARSLTAPRGWDLVRPAGDPAPPPDDLLALADALREGPAAPDRTARPAPRPAPRPVAGPVVRAAGRRGHLRVLPPA